MTETEIAIGEEEDRKEGTAEIGISEEIVGIGTLEGTAMTEIIEDQTEVDTIADHLGDLTETLEVVGVDLAQDLSTKTISGATGADSLDTLPESAEMQ